MIRKCLFPVAGYGTRFLPATKSIPKEMLNVVDKPIIHYGVKEAMDANLTDIVFITGRNKRSLEDYFDLNYELEDKIKSTKKESGLYEIREIMNKCQFSYTRQREIRGLGNAIYEAKHLVHDNAFAVILADDLCVYSDKGVIEQLIDVYEKNSNCCIVAVQSVDRKEIDRYGIVKYTNIKENIIDVEYLVEKPKIGTIDSNLAIIGRYILTQDIFEILADTPSGSGGEIQLTDALHEKAKRGEVKAVLFDGTRFDCGNVDGYIEATNYLYGRDEK